MQRSVVLVVSASEECFLRIQRLRQRDGGLDVEWVEIPSDIGKMMGRGRLIGGIILDLTWPRAAREDEQIKEAHDAWCITALIVMARGLERIPLLVVSAFAPLESALRQGGIPVVEQIAPQADDAIWRDALERLAASGQSKANSEDGEDHASGGLDAVHPLSYVMLGPNVWLDLEGSVLYREGRPLPLTAREVELLALLLHAPRGYLSASELARRLSRPYADYPMDEHCVEQMICNVRHKIGEASRQPHILVNRRRMGYALITQRPARTPVPPAAPAMAPATKLERTLNVH